MPSRRWKIPVIVGGIMVAVVAGGVAFFLYVAYSFVQAPVSDSVASTDSRVCPGSFGNNLPLDDATHAFHLRVPPGATNVKFTANSDFQGDDSLELRFTTTAAGLRSFYSSDAMPASPSPPSGQDLSSFDSDFAHSRCGAPPAHGPHLTYIQDPGTHDYYGERDILVNLSDPAHPEVWVNAMDV